jgi:hypothetical protein
VPHQPLPQDWQLVPGKLSNGEPLAVYGYPLSAGTGIPAGGELSFPLDPSYRRFTAIIGLGKGWQNAGPYEILLDGKLHWTSGKAFERNGSGQQINVDIPAGHKLFTIRIQGQESFGALGHAGFSTK